MKYFTAVILESTTIPKEQLPQLATYEGKPVLEQYIKPILEAFCENGKYGDSGNKYILATVEF